MGRSETFPRNASLGDGRRMPDADRKSWYVLALLVLTMIVSYVDRYVLAVLVQPIKTELHFSDTQIGILTGFAFSAVYAVFGVPIARIADRGRQREVIALSLVIWSVMTATCGMARSFAGLAAARFGVGAGEAGAMPASQSLIADLFPPHQRNTALAFLGSGGGIGIVVAFMFGGMLEARFGWRTTFFLVSLPGVVLAVLIWLTVAQPRGSGLDGAAAARPSAGSFRELLALPLFRHVPFAQASLALLQFAQAQWLPAYVERSFQLPRAEIGAKLALTHGLAGIMGMIVGGIVADRLSRRGDVWPIRVAIGGILLAAAPMAGVYLATDASWVFVFSAAMSFFLSIPAGPLFALVQTRVPRESRATAAAVTAMCAAFIGLGAGPLLIGMLSDQYKPATGDQSLRWAMLTIVALTLPWCLFHFGRVHHMLRNAPRN